MAVAKVVCSDRQWHASRYAFWPFREGGLIAGQARVTVRDPFCADG